MRRPEGNLYRWHRTRAATLRHRVGARQQADRHSAVGLKSSKEQADRARAPAAQIAGSPVGFLCPSIPMQAGRG